MPIYTRVNCHPPSRPLADRTPPLTVNEAALRMNVTPRFVRRLVEERRIAFLKVGRHIRFDVDDVDEFLAAGRVEPQR
jgi:excisionase family DNA binding protein